MHHDTPLVEVPKDKTNNIGTIMSEDNIEREKNVTEQHCIFDTEQLNEEMRVGNNKEDQHDGNHHIETVSMAPIADTNDREQKQTEDGKDDKETSSIQVPFVNEKNSICFDNFKTFLHYLR